MTTYFNNDFYGDCLILTDYIEDLEFYDNKRRQHINNNKGKTWSMLYGLTPYSAYKKDQRRIKDPDTNYYWSKARMEYPDLQEIFIEFGKLHFPDFKWRSIMINHNFECKPHYDSGNIGESIMIGLGDYSEGYLCIEDELTKKVTKHSTFHKIIKFNGSKNKHWTAPFSGNRLTLIFYNNTRF